MYPFRKIYCTIFCYYFAICLLVSDQKMFIFHILRHPLVRYATNVQQKLNALQKSSRINMKWMVFGGISRFLQFWLNIRVVNFQIQIQISFRFSCHSLDLWNCPSSGNIIVNPLLVLLSWKRNAWNNFYVIFQ